MWGAPTRFPPVFFFHNKQTLCKCVWKRVVFLWCPYLELLLLPVGGIGAFSTQECGCFPLLKFKGKSYHVFWLGLIRQCFSLKKFSDYAVFNDTTPHVYWMYVLYCIKCQVHSNRYTLLRGDLQKGNGKDFRDSLSQIAPFNFVFETRNKKWLLLISLHTYTSLSSRSNWIHLRKKRFIIAKFYYVWDVGGTTLNASNFSHFLANGSKTAKSEKSITTI